MSENAIVRLINDYCRPYLLHFGVSIVAMLLARAFWFFPPIVVGVLFDAVLIGDAPFRLPVVPQEAVPDGDTGQLLFAVGLLVGGYVMGYVLVVFAGLVRAVAAYRVQHSLRTTVYDHTQRLEYEFFEQERKGELISILNNDVNRLETFLNSTLGRAGNVAFTLVALTAYMLWLNAQLALVAFLAPAVVFVFSYVYSRYVEPRYEEMRSRVGDISSLIENNVSGIGVIKTYTQESFENERVATASRKYRDVSWVVRRARIVFSQLNNQLVYLGYSFVLLVGGVWVVSGPPGPLSGELAAGTLLTFTIYNRQFLYPLNLYTDVIDQYQAAKASSKRVFRLMDEQPESTGRGQRIDPHRPAVSFENVTFAYESADEPAVADVTFTVGGGETLGIVGPTGAGKSTVLKLLFGFYRPETGTVRIDATDIEAIDRTSLRSAIGYVSQDPYLFDGTVADNVAYGGDDPDRETIVAAAKVANAHEFVTELSDGYDTDVGEGGTRLSGGQRQRLALARAVVGDPEVLVLDEAMSSVDNSTEVLIQRSLERITAERTTLVVAHDLSSVRDADQIVVLEDGRVTERGTHRELADGTGLYADLWRIQVGEFDKVADVSRLEH